MRLALLIVAALALAVEAPQAPADDVLTGDGFGTVHKTTQFLFKSMAVQPGKKPPPQVFTAFKALDEQMQDLPAEKRQELIEERLPELNASVRASAAELKEYPVLARAVDLAAADLNLGAARFSDSREFASRVLARSPDDTAALVTRSLARRGLEDYAGALEDSERALKVSPEDADAYSARALAEYGLKDYKKAVDDARRALSIRPEDRTALALLKLAEARVPGAVTPDSQRLEAQVRRDRHVVDQQLTQAQARSLEPELRPSPLPAARMLKSASTKLGLRDYWGAVADAERALEHDPTSAAAYYYQACAYNMLGRYEDAAQNATLALSLNPNDPSARDARAWANNRLGRHLEAMADANHSLEIDPSDAYAYANRALANEKLGDLDAMASDLKRATELNPQFEPAYRDAVAAARLPLIPSPRSAAAAPGASEGRQRSFLVVLLSSIVGGLLIAAGIIHAWMGRSGGVKRGLDHTYEVKGVIGKGGMGTVYEAVDKALERKVAIKQLREEFQSDDSAKSRFLDEARTVAALHHPAIVEIHSILEDPSGLYLVFEHIEGRTVDELIRERGRLPLAEAKALLKPVCEALEYAHLKGLVHRDLKPSNIMISGDGRVKVMDFGISRNAKDAMTRTQRKKKGEPSFTSGTGTPCYMAPEQEYGVVRPESDIFSLGACLYELVTGRPAFSTASISSKLAQAYEKPSSIDPSLPAALDLLIDAALAPDPDKRIRTPADFWRLLERIRGAEPTVPHGFA